MFVAGLLCPCALILLDLLFTSCFKFHLDQLYLLRLYLFLSFKSGEAGLKASIAILSHLYQILGVVPGEVHLPWLPFTATHILTGHGASNYLPTSHLCSWRARLK